MSINLVETKTKLFFNSELNKISKKNFKKKSLVINICVFIIFILFLGGILLYRYKNKPKKKENVNDIKVRKYLLEKMRKFNKNEIKSDLITNLPVYSNDYNSRIL
jgi:flagellar basal body-associated protein FliL